MQGKTPFTAYPRLTAALTSSIGSSCTGRLGSLVVSRFLGSPYAAVGIVDVGSVGGMLAKGCALDAHYNYRILSAKIHLKVF